MCDLLISFCKQLEDNPLLRPLVYEPDRALQTTLIDFIQTYVFVEEDDEEQDEHTKIEELHKRRRYYIKIHIQVWPASVTLLDLYFS